MLAKKLKELKHIRAQPCEPAYPPQHIFANEEEIKAAMVLPYAQRDLATRIQWWTQKMSRSVLARWMREMRGVVDLR